MNTATASKCFGLTSIRIDFTRASGKCCALLTGAGHWELYKIDNGLELFAGYAAGDAVTELERVREKCRIVVEAVDYTGKSKTVTVETMLDTIEIKTTLRTPAQAA